VRRDDVFATSCEYQGNGREEEEHGELNRPTTHGGEGENGCTVCHRHGYEHVERYDSCGRTREKSDDEEQGGYNFAHQCTVGEKFGHTHACKHTFDAGKSVCYLKDTVEEEHKTNAYSENEKSNVLIA